MKHLLFISFFILLGMVSCDKIVELNANQTDLVTKSTQSEFFTLSITYEENSYSVPCELRQDSLIFLDNDFNILYQEQIADNSHMVTLCNPDGSLIFYNSKEEFVKNNNYKSVNINKELLTATGIMGNVTLWDDRNYKDRAKSYNASLTQFVEREQLRDDGDFNDKTSSLKLVYKDTDPKYCVIFEGYENDNYQGRSLIYVANAYNSSIEVPNLKNVPCGKGNWNDRITSFTLQIKEN